MVFFTYNRTTYEITGVYPTQALANTAASEDATTIAAYTGSTDILDVQPDGNWYHFAEAPIVRLQPRITYPVRAAFQAWHDRMDELSLILESFGPINYPQWALNLSHDSLHALHIFGYVLWHWTAVPNADKVKALQAASLGPNDVNAASEARYNRERPETIFPIMTDMWENNVSHRPRIQTVGERVLPVVNITIESDSSVTIARRSLLEMYTTTDDAILSRPVPSLTELDACSYVDEINA